MAEAGRPGQVTIATNMAGRGTDIKLTPEEVKRPGGLAIIGTERHESRRVDRQLRGRAGRQGDPGSSQFFRPRSEDDLDASVRFSGRIAAMMDRMGLKEGEALQAKICSNAIERAQKKVEENNFGIRKRSPEYRRRDELAARGDLHPPPPRPLRRADRDRPEQHPLRLRRELRRAARRHRLRGFPLRAGSAKWPSSRRSGPRHMPRRNPPSWRSGSSRICRSSTPDAPKRWPTRYAPSWSASTRSARSSWTATSISRLRTAIWATTCRSTCAAVRRRTGPRSTRSSPRW